jgi:hypothetical protein
VRSSRALLASSFALAALSACVLDWDSLRATSVPDSGVDAGDDATDDGGTDAADDADAAPACKLILLVNEVQVAGPQGASDEFVELLNLADCAGPLTGYELRYSSASGSNPNVVWAGTTETIEAHGYAVVAGKNFQGTTNLIGRFSGDTGNGILAATGGGVGIFGPDLLMADSVAYDVITTKTHPFVRPATAPDGGQAPAAPNPTSGKSIARTPDGQNTNSSAADFKLTTTPTPGATN